MKRAALQKQAKEAAEMSRENPARIFTEAEAKHIVDVMQESTRGGGILESVSGSVWTQNIRWARNAVMIAGDRFERTVLVGRQLPEKQSCGAASNQIDDNTIRNLVRMAERRSSLSSPSGVGRGGRPFQVPVDALPVPAVSLMSNQTTQTTADARARLAALLAESAEAKKLLSAGSIEVRIGCRAIYDEVYGLQYEAYSQAESSVTVRHPRGAGSGWAGVAHFDWNAIDPVQLADRALSKCLASIDPVRVEPGRYTVILEPQAVFDLINTLVLSFNRISAERGRGPWALGKDHGLDLIMLKTGTQVVDKRVNIFHDPISPGTAVFSGPGMRTIEWIKDGVLTTLDTAMGVSGARNYSLEKLNQTAPDYRRYSFQMSGGTSTIDDMIGTTKRGLLVTRFANVLQLDEKSLLSTGITRDGVWLIENGAITKAVKNLRFIESPLFVLNQLEQLGAPQQVFRRSIAGGGSMADVTRIYMGPQNAVVPPIKARDFNFAALVEAV